LLVLSSSDLDKLRQQFVASAGLIVASLDDKIEKDEVDHILGVLANYTVFPTDFLNMISESGKVDEIFGDSIQKILQMNPGERIPMMQYLIKVGLANRDISKKEVEFFFKIGEELMGLSHKEVVQVLAEQITTGFMPELF